VTCPDVVGDAAATLGRFHEWKTEIRELGFRLAFAGQDGCAASSIPWDEFEALFIGGSDRWKESHEAMCLADLGKVRGKWVHVGRVNSFRRFRKLWDWDSVDSIDGRSFSAWPEIYMPKLVGWLSRLEDQSRLPFIDPDLELLSS
jgi:hypothetical protein